MTRMTREAFAEKVPFWQRTNRWTIIREAILRPDLWRRVAPQIGLSSHDAAAIARAVELSTLREYQSDPKQLPHNLQVDMVHTALSCWLA